MVSFNNKHDYFVRHAFLPQQLFEAVPADLNMAVVIPCYDEPDVISTLQSLFDCERPQRSTEVILVINASENEKQKVLEQNLITKEAVEVWIKNHPDDKIKFYTIEVTLPQKHAGVGLARKAGMDEAARRFDSVFNPNGIIVCLDADSGCDKNYLTEIEKHFSEYPSTNACSIYFEHPVSGNEYSEEIYQGIIYYELFLRYYVQALRFAGFPFAYHTIGSSMAVRSGTYKSQGGMNRRKAGEDFYFLHKVIPLGNFSEIKTTRVIPSPRVSYRVPFGTGRAMLKWLDNLSDPYTVYDPKIFSELKLFMENIDKYTESFDRNDILSDRCISLPLKEFLDMNHFNDKMKEIGENVSGANQFKARFFQWFNGFMALKYVHYARDHYYKNINIVTACDELLTISGMKNKTINNPELSFPLAYLELFRKLDRNGHLRS